MTRFIALILGTVMTCAGAFCDDGGTRNPDEWTYGNIYVTTQNTAISLENEFMYVNQHSMDVRAVFDFKNNSAADITVPCAFPVIINIPYEYDGKVIFSNDFRVRYDEGALSLAFEKKGNVREVNPMDYNEKFRVVSIDEYMESYSNFSNLSKASSGDWNEYKPVEILQDGKKVPVTKVGIETKVTISNKMDENERKLSYKGVITLKLHFYHELKFARGKNSTVEANYKIDMRKGRKRGEFYNGFYDIYTGGTWKGPIKNFIMLTDASVKVHNSSSRFSSQELFNFGTYSYSSGMILSIQNYNPAKNEFFEFVADSYDDEMSSCYILEDREKCNFVNGVKASSYLKGDFSINEKKFDYKPEASFDGNILNGWVEGVAGDGIGEWIEFTLTKPAFGPFMTNGLTHKFSIEDYGKKEWDWDFRHDDERYTADDIENLSWSKNNRIKKMSLENISTGEKKDLNLKDIYAGEKNYGETQRMWITCNANKNPSILMPGTYRMYIKNVYKGTKWDDTVLGEVWFYNFGDAADRILMEEKKTGRNFFLKEVQKYLEMHSVKKYF